MKMRHSWLGLALFAASALLMNCGSEAPPENGTAKTAEDVAEAPPVIPPEEPAEEAKPVEPAPAEKAAPKAAPKTAEKKAAGPPVVLLETSKGPIRIELYPERAPKTVQNFLSYVDSGFYNGTIFHRVIPNFMVQGGGFTPDMREKETRAAVENEARQSGLANTRGAIAMARTSEPHSATAQFFINHATNRFLDADQAQDGWGYAVFGKVIEGMEVVDAITAVPTGNRGPHGDVPVEPVVIQSARIVS